MILIYHKLKSAMKDYLITILMRDIVLINEQVWKAESMEEAEKKVNHFLTQRQFNGKLGRKDVVRKTEELNGDHIKWLEVITQSGDNAEVVFFISVEEETSKRWALKNA
jgi:hypothetical protein